MAHCVVKVDNASVYVYEDFEVVFAATPIRSELVRAHDGFIQCGLDKASRAINETLGDAGYIRIADWKRHGKGFGLATTVIRDDEPIPFYPV